MEHFQEFEHLYHLKKFQQTLSDKGLRNGRLELFVIGFLALSSLVFITLCLLTIFYFENTGVTFFTFMATLIASVFSILVCLHNVVEFFNRSERCIMFYSTEDLISKINNQTPDAPSHPYLRMVLNEYISSSFAFATYSRSPKHKIMDNLTPVIQNLTHKLQSQPKLREIASELKHQDKLKPNHPMALFFKQFVQDYNEQVKINNRQAREFSRVFKQAGIDVNTIPAYNNKPFLIEENKS